VGRGGLRPDRLATPVSGPAVGPVVPQANLGQSAQLRLEIGRPVSIYPDVTARMSSNSDTVKESTRRRVIPTGSFGATPAPVAMRIVYVQHNLRLLLLP